MEFITQNNDRKWNNPDENFRIDFCIAQIYGCMKKMTIIFSLEAILPIVIITSCIVATGGSTEVVRALITTLIPIGILAMLIFILAMFIKIKAIRDRSFVWQVGMVDKSYNGRKGKVWTRVNGEIKGCFPFASLSKFGDGDKVLVVRLVGYISQPLVFVLQE